MILDNKALRKIFSHEKRMKKVTQCAATKFVFIAKID